MLLRILRQTFLFLLTLMIAWRTPPGDSLAMWDSALDDRPLATVPPVPDGSMTYLPLVRAKRAESALAAGADHTCALTAKGDVMCWGSNEYGQLGDGTTELRLTPVTVVGLQRNVRALVAGASHTCALTTGGGVKCWGENDSGQLGDGGGGTVCGVDYSAQCRLTPVDVMGLSRHVRTIAAGDFHTCALTTDGGVKCWGSNTSGQLGDGTPGMHLIPVDVVGLSTGVSAIAAGGHHTCAITGDGVKCWGGNWLGQLGNGTTKTQMKPVAVTGLQTGIQALTAGTSHTCALTSAKGVKCWGANYYGQVGNDSTVDALRPANVVGLSTGISAIAAGGHHTCAMNGDRVECWGGNWRGQIGNGSVTEQLTPVTVEGLPSGIQVVTAGYSHTCTVATLRHIKCWGYNQYGQLGDGGGGVSCGSSSSERCRLTPVDVTWP